MDHTASSTASIASIRYYPTARQWIWIDSQLARLGIGKNTLIVRIMDDVIDREGD
jgi:hypothetical protein